MAGLTLSSTPDNKIVLLSAVTNEAVTAEPAAAPEGTCNEIAPLCKNLPLLANTSTACVMALRVVVTLLTAMLVEPLNTLAVGTSPWAALYFTWKFT